MEKTNKTDYKIEIERIIMNLPKAKIRKIPYITKLPNPAHIRVYEEILQIIETIKSCSKFELNQLKQKNSELENTLNETKKQYNSHWDFLARTMPDYTLRQEIKNRDEEEAYDENVQRS